MMIIIIIFLLYSLILNLSLNIFLIFVCENRKVGVEMLEAREIAIWTRVVREGISANSGGQSRS